MTGASGRRVVLFAGALLAVVGVGAAVAVLLTQTGSSPASAGGAVRYGGIPSWLPNAKVPVERTVRASSTHPALAIQGNTVSVELRHGRVLATAVGPSVPEEGRFPVPATTPCTFVVTFAKGSQDVPLNAGAFAIVDDLGHVHHPRVSAMNDGPPPRDVPAGKTVSVRVHDVLPTGDGGLSWAPDGGRPIVSWDFDVEID